MDEQAEFLRVGVVAKLLGVDTSTVWRWVKTNDFPAPVKMGPKSTGWLRADVEAWIASRYENRTKATVNPIPARQEKVVGQVVGPKIRTLQVAEVI